MTALIKTFQRPKAVTQSTFFGTTPDTPSVVTIKQLPAPVNLELYCGDDFTHEFPVNDHLGAPIDLTGGSAEAQIRTTAESPAIAASFICTVAGNNVTIKLAGADTQTLKGSLVWDCQITDSAGLVLTPVGGSVTFTPDVTRE